MKKLSVGVRARGRHVVHRSNGGREPLGRGERCAPSKDPEACGDSVRIQQFAAWAASVAQRFPDVTHFVVMNECNQPRFVNPQWDAAGGNQSAEICGRALAAAYDGIKAVSSTDFVWGIGLSRRGNDSPNAARGQSDREERRPRPCAPRVRARGVRQVPLTEVPWQLASRCRSRTARSGRGHMYIRF